MFTYCRGRGRERVADLLDGHGLYVEVEEGNEIYKPAYGTNGHGDPLRACGQDCQAVSFRTCRPSKPGASSLHDRRRLSAGTAHVHMC